MMVKLNGCIFQLLLTGNIFRIKLVLILKNNMIASLFTIIFFEKKKKKMQKKCNFEKRVWYIFSKLFITLQHNNIFGCTGLFYEL